MALASGVRLGPYEMVSALVHHGQRGGPLRATMVTRGQTLAIEFLPPRDVVFSCSECGDCCRSLNVPVAPAEREALEGLSWEGREERLVGKPATVPTMGQAGPGRRLPREEDGSCTYLGEDGLCLIHRHFGVGNKPSACRLYPFSFHRLGDSVAVDCAFSCRAVSRGQGRSLARHPPAATRRSGPGPISRARVRPRHGPGRLPRAPRPRADRRRHPTTRPRPPVGPAPAARPGWRRRG